VPGHWGGVVGGASAPVMTRIMTLIITKGHYTAALRWISKIIKVSYSCC